MSKFNFHVGDRVEDLITGFSGIVICRAQWLNNCNTYQVQPVELKDGQPLAVVCFDEPQLKLLESEAVVPSKPQTGGPPRHIQATNRMRS